jgi:alkanesulfonate monooxygenase SsuD/methylene tetrahydromethanopterin reductase-like flavin-dependent oxidoreductase (luciferase family)
MTTRLSGTGIWSSTLRYGDAHEAAALAAELEGLGYSALWIPDVGGDLFGPLSNLLGATTTATIATGILNVWMHTPNETAAEHARLTAEHGPRFLCGIGISHRPLIDHANEPGTYRKPLESMAAYLDGLVVWGDEATIAARVQEHRDAGADHVCIQVLTDNAMGFPAEEWRALAPALTG